MGKCRDDHYSVYYLELLTSIIKLWDKRSLHEACHIFEAPKGKYHIK